MQKYYSIVNTLKDVFMKFLLYDRFSLSKALTAKRYVSISSTYFWAFKIIISDNMQICTFPYAHFVLYHQSLFEH